MWKHILDLIKRVATLTQDTQKNKADIQVLQAQMKALMETVRDLAHEIERDRENQAHEHEKLLLRLEVALLRSEQRILTGKPNQPPLLSDTDSSTPSE